MDEAEAASLAALKRLVVILGGHFLEIESSRLVETVKRVTDERGTTYVVLGTPDERRRIEILRGSLVSALVRELHGIDIRVVANRADREDDL
jgi:K+-sensing histidine kinase KdpD